MKWDGVMLIVSALQPAQVRGNRSKVKNYWINEQRKFIKGGLVCIAVGVDLTSKAEGGKTQAKKEEDGLSGEEDWPRYSPAAAKHLIFATVANRSEEGLSFSPERFHLGLRLASPVDLLKFSDMLRRWSSTSSSLSSPSTNLLVEARGVFFTACDPVLRTLQAHNNPYVGHIPADIELLLYQHADSMDVYTSKPEFLTSSRFWSLDTLLSNKMKTGPERERQQALHALARVEVEDFAQLRDTLRPLSAQGLIKLDDSQVDAFAAALTRKCCLIQGPPGTGKSYVGTQIVQAILRQKIKDLGPILCVCYTNHALDQFLEGLHDDGVPLESFVRIGSRSKSEILPQRNLRQVASQQQYTKQEHFRVQQLRKRLDGLERELDKLYGTRPDGRIGEAADGVVGRLKRKQERGFLLWLRDTYPYHFQEICERDTDADGFQLAGGKGRGSGSEEDKQVENLFKWMKAKWSPFQHHQIARELSEHAESKTEREIHAPAKGEVLSRFQVLDLDGVEEAKEEEKVEASTAPRPNVGGSPSKQEEVPQDLQYIDDAEFESEEDLLEADSELMWLLSPATRERLVDIWKTTWMQYQERRIQSNLTEYEKSVEELQELTSSRDLRVLKKAKIIGLTTTGCAQHQKLIQALKPKIVICEEAGEVLEAHLLSCMTSGLQQLIQIGDHFQLRPTVNEYELSIQSKRGHDLDFSLFERLIMHRQRVAEADLASRGIARSQESILTAMKDSGILVTLLQQRRMHPDIADLIRFTLYPDLEDEPALRRYPPLSGFAQRLWFMDHNHPEAAEEVSKVNNFEAELIVELALYAVKQGYSQKGIALLTPYLGQLMLIRRLLKKKQLRVEIGEQDASAIADVTGENEEAEDVREEVKAANGRGGAQSFKIKQALDCIRLSTVDNFQGNEADLVLVSTVRCNKDGRVGFLKVFNRVNVLLSRAKHGMILLGSLRTIRKCRSAGIEMFHKVVDILEAKGAIGQDYITLACQNHRQETRISTPEQLRERVADGGCSLPCEARMACGHACNRQCHPDDPGHIMGICAEPCSREVPTCGHLCKQLCCDQPCRCDVVLPEYSLPCGHIAKRVSCTVIHSGRSIPCKATVAYKMPFCRHTMEIPCHTAQKWAQDAKNLGAWTLAGRCKAKCGSLLPCSHSCCHSCGSCFLSSLQEATDREYEKLSGGTVDESAAAREMVKHSLREQLGETVARERKTHSGPCEHPCERALSCGHSCDATPCHTADQCPPCHRPCNNVCIHSACSRYCKDPCASCAEPCVWSCDHDPTLKCPLPCGSPCVRLPCDKRCKKRLSGCGHQCPGLCGEICLPREYCRECGPAVCVRGEDIVDLIMLTTLQDHNPDESPLLVLPCGHCFTAETLDGSLGMTQLYQQDPNTEAWIKPLPLRPESNLSSTIHCCPTCKMPITLRAQNNSKLLPLSKTSKGKGKPQQLQSSLRRYGRRINFSRLQQAEAKFLYSIRESTHSFAKKREALISNGRHLKELVEAVGSQVKVETYRTFIEDFLLSFNTVKAQYTPQKLKAPSEIVLVKERSRLHNLGYGDMALNLESFRNTMSAQPLIQAKMELLRWCVSIVEAMEIPVRILQEAEAAKKQDTQSPAGNGRKDDIRKKERGKNRQRQSLLTFNIDAEALAKKIEEVYADGIAFSLALQEKCDATGAKQSGIETLALEIRLEAFHLMAMSRIQWGNTSLDAAEYLRKVEKAKEAMDKALLALQRRILEKHHCSGSAQRPMTADINAFKISEARALIDSTYNAAKKVNQPLTPEEKRAILMATVQGTVDGTAGYGGFGGHWYECPNGHPYLVTECGGPMQLYTCPECGATIGGQSHRPADGNVGAASFFAAVRRS